MIALVDIGNTRLKWALAAGERLSAVGGAAHVDDAEAAVDAFVDALPGDVDRAIVANVAGASIEARLAAVLRERRSISAEFVAPQTQAYGIRCAYAHPEQLGVDRWVAMIAGRRAVADDFCVIQAGTAVTFDAVDAHGRHLGGLILAGPRLIADALQRKTGRIGPTAPVLERPAGLDLLGRSTEAAVGNGAMLSIAAALDRATAAVAAEGLRSPTILLTGGDAAVLRPWLETTVRTSADLVLAGLAYIADQGG